MLNLSRRPVVHHRPGLTLVELLAAIALLGVAGLLLLPRLDPASRMAPADEAGSPPAACPFISDISPSAGYSLDFDPAAYVGIGAILEKELSSDGFVQIRYPFRGSPAEEAGLAPGDQITAVDGVPTQDISIDGVRDRIRDGEPGSIVRLTVRRSGSERPLDLTITREWVHPRIQFVAE